MKMVQSTGTTAPAVTSLSEVNMSKFHIEGDWYLVPDEYTWNLCRKSYAEKRHSEWAEITYHRTPQDALNHYFDLKVQETARKAGDGTLKDLVDILSTENKRLSELLKTAFAEVCELGLGDDSW